uniref:Glyco_trans_2-like domain-containing protein n=1 Tax=Trichuris muris TaxID=70415 RepID=A0A5S6QKQ8_TRIMR
MLGRLVALCEKSGSLAAHSAKLLQRSAHGQVPPFSPPKPTAEVKLARFIVAISIPLIGFLGYQSYRVEKEHENHPRDPYIDYDHLYAHRKARRLPYGDGIRTPFHNPYRNALPGIGYEAEDPYVTKMKAQGKDPEETSCCLMCDSRYVKFTPFHRNVARRSSCLSTRGSTEVNETVPTVLIFRSIHPYALSRVPFLMTIAFSPSVTECVPLAVLLIVCLVKRYVSYVPETVTHCLASGPSLQCWSGSPLFSLEKVIDEPEIIFPDESLTKWASSSEHYKLFAPNFLLRVQNYKELKRHDRGSAYHGFDLLVSDKLGPHRRTLPDTRHPLCLNETYSIGHLPNVSLIINYYNEALSVLIRMVNGIIQRTPAKLLHEILLIDDNSDRDFACEEKLREYASMASWPKVVRFMGTRKREGLIRARIFGARQASGQVLVFLDSHCEVNVGWLQPLLIRVAEDPTRVVSPVVDHISPTTFEYSASVICRGGFDWMLNFQWLYFSSSFFKEPTNSVIPFRTPAVSGGLFAVNKKFFHHVGEFDPGMDIWGAENIEFSIRVWLCGGSLEIAPCSRVGHVFRVYRPYATPKGANTPEKNAVRAVRVWLDEYAERFFAYKPSAASLDVGSLQERIDLRKRLQCHSFHWYLGRVYPELATKLVFALLGK